MSDPTPDPVELPTDLVMIKNPSLPASDPATTSREAFEQLWEERGFVIVGDDGEPLKTKAKTTKATADTDRSASK